MTREKTCVTCAFADIPMRLAPCKGCYAKSNWHPEGPADLPLSAQRAAESALYQTLNTDLMNAFKAPQAAPLDSLDAMEGAEAPADCTCKGAPHGLFCPAHTAEDDRDHLTPSGAKPLTGGSSDYYKVAIAEPTTPGTPAYTAECNDIIEALKMDYALGNIFKAVWRIAKSRMGSGKSGTTTLYDAEKVAFFGNRLVSMEKAK